MAAPPLYCPNAARLARVRDDGRFNGVEFLEVLDNDAPASEPPQQTLLLHCLRPVAGLTRANVRIDGGVRVTNVGVSWAAAANSAAIPAGLQPFLTAHLTAGERPKVLVIRTDRRGDFSTYTLRLILSPGQPNEPPAGFDRLLTAVDFWFKADCPSDFDCATRRDCPTPQRPAPRIDYLAKDFTSFRRLMLDRMAVLAPAWTERNAADLGITLVEVLAYAADYLSYCQDAVATEAYLGTARRRVSVRRHCRLIDYVLDEGSNARTWVCVDVGPGSGADGATLPTGTPILTRAAATVAAAVSAGAVVFETLHPAKLRAGRFEIPFYSWGDPHCCLPRGATAATLLGKKADLDLHDGDVLVFEEVRGPGGAPADPTHRHAVRLLGDPVERTDPLPTPAVTVCEVRWATVDALPFPLCLEEDTHGAKASVARGNVMLADHGLTVRDEPLNPPAVPDGEPYRPGLSRAGLTFRARYDHATARQQPAATATAPDHRTVEPAATLEGDGLTWEARSDLLGSDRFAPVFVVEMENDRRAELRFGDGVLGRQPPPGTTFSATYRVGGGSTGNIGAEALIQLADAPDGVRLVRNPLPAVGGTNPEPLEQARQRAPYAFRTQERAVTEADYAAAAQRHPDVQRAAATRRWTGSWYTMFLTIDRLGGRPVDDAFAAELRDLLERFRLAGVDLEIEAPVFVPLDIALMVCVAPDQVRGKVVQVLDDVFSSADLPGGGRGFFHPDNFTFGQPVFLSRVVTAAMNVPGVNWVQPVRFQKAGRPPAGELAAGAISMDRLEIARLDNDPNRPENGKLEFLAEGGL